MPCPAAQVLSSMPRPAQFESYNARAWHWNAQHNPELIQGLIEMEQIVEAALENRRRIMAEEAEAAAAAAAAKAVAAVAGAAAAAVDDAPDLPSDAETLPFGRRDSEDEEGGTFTRRHITRSVLPVTLER